MFCIKRALVVLLLSMTTVPACAFTFSYGNLFEVKDVKNKNGVLQMPLTRKKYKNVKVLSKELYGFLRQCAADCRYAVQEPEIAVAEYRAAAGNPNMWIADLSFNSEILLTFLVFQNPNGFRVKFPEAVKFTDTALQKRVENYIEQTAAEKI